MGGSVSSPVAGAGNSGAAVLTESPTNGCPVQHVSPSPNSASQLSVSECPAQNRVNVQTSQCPVTASGCDSSTMDSNSDALDPTNMMPPPNQLPSPGQPFPLPTKRQVSSIPRGGLDKDEKWMYPSQQMFWNAMLRKGWKWKDDEVQPKDMDHIIKIHNANNEAAWEEILKWEALHFNECRSPKLLSFRGKAKEFSPRARIRSWLGYELPFDRHDWVVDRCGREVRYIIDYYDIGDEDAYKTGEFVFLDVRPAMDSFQAVLDRARVCVLRWTLYFSGKEN
ncbi:holocytochrome c-type synthase-like [Acropora palmata]